jgi:hypothetical protein
MLTPAHIIIYDQMPVSRHEDIKVKLQDAPVRLAEQTELNILKWEFSLPPNAKREIPFSFAIDFPRDIDVAGLNGYE